MKVLAENYKGIEFIRITKLPEEQRKQIVQAIPSDHIIKILRESELLTDCVQFKHYEAWFNQNFKKEATPDQTTVSASSESIKIRQR
ncbi:MAG TPA: hypothetical protein PK185_08435 [Cyclobacteriaceae bacterium]|nr:hypothetical protein [Cyclobacteriaceae bacterium]